MKKGGGKLFIVATPIGNLEDTTLRALRTLKEADVVLCEDTRVTQKLLARYGIRKPLLSYHQHSRLQRIEQILNLFEEEKNLALVSDAGTPGISDPGNELIAAILARFGTQAQIAPIPGASAVTAITSIAGIPTQRFSFLGYPPVKKGRKKFFKDIAASAVPVILYESSHRIVRTLIEVRAATGESRAVVIGRELTKKFEEIFRGKIEDACAWAGAKTPRGEYVLLLVPKKQ